MRSPAHRERLTTAWRRCGAAALGIALFRLAAWAQLSGTLAAAGNEFVAASHIVQLLAMVLVLVANRFVGYTRSQVLRAAGIATLCTLAGVGVYLVGPDGAPTLFLGGTITGAVSSVVVLAWGYYLCSVDPRRSALEVAGGFALYGLLTLACAELPAAAVSALALVGPLLSYGCLRVGFATLGDESETPVPVDAPPHLTRDTLAMFAVLGACMLVNLLGKVLIPLDEEPHALLHRLLWPLLFVAVFAAVCLWLLVFKRPNAEGLWPLFVLVMASGLLGYPAFTAVDPVFASAYLRASQDCLMLFCWVVVASLAYRHGYAQLPFFGWTTVAFVKPPLIVSSVLLVALSQTLADRGEPLTMAVTGGAAFVLVAVVAVLASTGASPREESKPSEDGYSTTLERAARALQATYGLTQRETDVAMLLARGNTMVQTAAELHVSLDTVRAHAKSLYRKMDIHKKQDLVARVDGLLRKVHE